jgi:hypothetical protein
MLAVLGSQGAEVVMTIDGATDVEVFWLVGAAVFRPTRRLGDMADSAPDFAATLTRMLSLHQSWDGFVKWQFLGTPLE